MRKVVLMLKTPPPFGGGEVQAGWLAAHFCRDDTYVIFKMTHTRQSRENAGIPSLRRVLEFLYDEIRLALYLLKHKPVLVYKNTGHGILNFIRDSVYFWTARYAGASFMGELAGERFHFLDANGIGARYGRFVLSRFSSIRVLGSNIASDLAAKGINNAHICDNGVPVPDIRVRYPDKLEQPFRVLFVGLHSPSKGFDILVNAMGRLIQNDINCELHMIGQWHTREFQTRIQNLIESRGWSSGFHFHGLTTGEDKWRVFAQCHALALPSLTEGQPLCILEALGCGMPVIATPVGGIPDMIEEGVHGFLITPANEQLLSDAISRLIYNRDMWTHMSEANRRLYLSRFTLDRYLKSFAACIQRSVSQSNSVKKEAVEVPR